MTEYASTLPHVAHADHYLFACASDNQKKMSDVVREHDLNRVVVASCSPRTHEPLFQDTIRKAGLNKYLMEMANIRDQCSWVHAGDPQRATEKAKDLVRMSVARSVLLEPLRELPSEVIQSGLVIGGGVAGMTAALNLAGQGFQVDLVEREAELGGNAAKLTRGPRGEDIREFLRATVDAVQASPGIRTLTNAVVLDLDPVGPVVGGKLQLDQGYPPCGSPGDVV